MKCYALLLFWRNARHEFEQAPGVGDGQGSLAVHGVAKSQT